MSLQFSDIANRKGIVQIYEQECGFTPDYVANNPTYLKQLAADVNLALDDFINIALRTGGTWQFDDSNQLDYPIITTDLIAGKQEYNFVTDQKGNIILDIYKVFVKDPGSGAFYQLYPIDAQSGDDRVLYDTISITNGLNQAGNPTEYDKFGNGVFLNYIPQNTIAGGLKVYVNREGSYFTSADTTKKPGVPGLFHRYFAIKPALDYARRNYLENYNSLSAEVIKFEGDPERGIIGSIERYFGGRQRDAVSRMTAAPQYNK